eukprot:2312700-Alexandrium_andersonii.AAC.1
MGLPETALWGCPQMLASTVGSGEAEVESAALGSGRRWLVFRLWRCEPARGAEAGLRVLPDGPPGGDRRGARAH